MALALVALIALVVAVVVCLRRPGIATASVLAVLSAVWLPLNNGRLEGPVLLSVDADHGLTASDLVGYAGIVIAVVVLVRGARRRGSTWTRYVLPAAAAGVFAVGLLIAYFFQPGGSR